MKTMPVDCGREHPQPHCTCVECHVAPFVTALRLIEAHHVELNRMKGRPEARSKTLAICRGALKGVPS